MMEKHLEDKKKMEDKREGILEEETLKEEKVVEKGGEESPKREPETGLEEEFEEPYAPEDLVVFDHVTKKFGKNLALDSITLSIPKGHVVGLMGPNAAGKTTFLKLLAGLTRPSVGRIEIDGMEIGIETKKVVSFLPDEYHLYENFRIRDAIQFFSDFYEDFDEDRCHQLLEQMGLNPKDKIRSLSKGYQERVTVALVLSRRAKLYLLDEPIGGADPLAREEILTLILENIGEDSTMIISTHMIAEMERMFDDVIFLNEGKVLLYENAEVVRAREGMLLEDVYKKLYRGVR